MKFHICEGIFLLLGLVSYIMSNYLLTIVMVGIVVELMLIEEYRKRKGLKRKKY